MNKSSFVASFKRFFTSLLVLLLSYILTVLSYQYFTGIFLIIWGYEPIISFNAIQGLPLDASFWSRPRITLIFGSGTLWMILQGILAWWGFSSYQSGKTSVFRYWLLWFGLLSFNYALIQLFTISAGEFDTKWSLYQGPAMVASWWHIPAVLSVPFGLVFAAGSMALGYFYCPFLLRFIHSSRAGAWPNSRKKFIITNFVLPVLFVGPLLFPLLTPYSWVLHVALLSNLLFMSIGVLLRSEYIQIGVKAHRKDVLNQWAVVLGGVTVAIYFFILIGLR